MQAYEHRCTAPSGETWRAFSVIKHSISTDQISCSPFREFSIDRDSPSRSSRTLDVASPSSQAELELSSRIGPRQETYTRSDKKSKCRLCMVKKTSILQRGKQREQQESGTLAASSKSSRKKSKSKGPPSTSKSTALYEHTPVETWRCSSIVSSQVDCPCHHPDHACELHTQMN